MALTPAAATFAVEVYVMLQTEDSHLRECVRRGDRRARESLVAEYLPVVRAIAFRCRAFGLPVDDLVQEGSLGLLDAIERYEPQRGSAFAAFARFRIRDAIRDALADRAVVDDGVPLEALTADTSARDPEDEAVEHEQEQEVDDAVAALPERQREIVSRHFGLGREAEQLADVAAALHVSQQRARAIERDALYALRDRLEPSRS